MITPAQLDALMDRGWPALDTVDVDGWIVRRSSGVTQRANSVLPAGTPRDAEAALSRVERFYAAEGLAPAFQVTPAAQPTGLDGFLAQHGYALQSPTLAKVAELPEVLRRLPSGGPEASVADAPSDAWMRLWWSVDGRRGGAEPQAVARGIMTGGKALYASTPWDGGGLAAVGRLALVDDWGGLFSLAVRPEARGNGQATAIISALLGRAAELGVRRTWLQVLADNEPALRLYKRLGYTTAASYHYRTRPPQGS